MKIYIAASWRHQHAVEMLAHLLEIRGHVVLSFVRNNEKEGPLDLTREKRPFDFEEWVYSPSGSRCFDFDTKGATESDLVVYIGPSGKDAAAEVGAAWAKGVPVFGLAAKGEDFGLMRRMIKWYPDFESILVAVGCLESEKEKKG